MVVRPKDDSIDLRYLEYYFRGGIDISQAITGAAQPQITRTNLEPLTIQFPTSLDEQRRIVAVLDKAFAAIATATANAQTNLTNARALFERYLESTFDNKGDGWKAVTLGKACKVERGSSPRPIKSFVTTEDDGQNWIKIGDTKNDSKYVTHTKQRITPAGALKSRKVEPGDFILTNSMSFGKPYIMKISGYIHDGWFALRLHEGVDTEYFYYLLSSPIVQKQFQNLAAGAIVLNISGDLVKKAILPIPSVEQQREIVNNIQLFDDETRNLVSIYEAKLTALAELKQSLLQKAFAGELTATVAEATAPAANDNYATPMFTAQVIAFAQRLHEKQGKQQTFGHVKTQKALHLVESIGGIDLGRQPIKDAAGPNDMQHMLRATDWAAQQGFFEFVPRANSKGYDFKKLANYDALWAEAETATNPVLAELSKAVGLIVDSDSDFAELIATTHAAWNNLIIDKAVITDDAIVLAARDNWHESKLRHDPSRFHDAIRFIRTNNIIPDGSAKYVGGQGSLL